MEETDPALAERYQCNTGVGATLLMVLHGGQKDILLALYWIEHQCLMPRRSMGVKNLSVLACFWELGPQKSDCGRLR